MLTARDSGLRARRASRLATLLAVLCATFSAPVGADPMPPDAREYAAATLFDRGMELFDRGDVASARKMFSESLELSPEGSRAADALRMLRECNDKLGVEDPDAGRPTGIEDPIDPYGEQGESDGPVDPYGQGAGDPDGPLDPFGDGAGAGGSTGPAATPENDTLARVGLITAGGSLGFVLTSTLLGPGEDTNGNGSVDSLKGGAVALGLLGAGAGIYLGHYAMDALKLKPGEATAIASGTIWGQYAFLHLANVFSGADSDVNDIFQGMTVGGLVGAGAGYLWAKQGEPSLGEVTYVNSLTAYGTTMSLFLGVAMDPPRGDAYSLNAALGTFAGAGAGLYLGGEASRRRMWLVDAGAAAGALLPWVVLYPATGSARGAGFFSALGVAGGAYLAWGLTKPKESESSTEAPPADAGQPASLLHHHRGHISTGFPMVRPMYAPELAPATGTSLGVDLLTGRF